MHFKYQCVSTAYDFPGHQTRCSSHDFIRAGILLMELTLIVINQSLFIIQMVDMSSAVNFGQHAYDVYIKHYLYIKRKI
jgi:hypothetical protein